MSKRGFVVAAACSALLSQMSSSVHGQSTPESCIQVLDSSEREMRAFHNDLRRESVDFGLDDASMDLWSEGKRALRNVSNPGQGAADSLQRVKDGLQSYVDSINEHKATMAALAACITPGSGCNLQEFAKKVSQEMKQWLQSLAEGSTGAAIARVEKASKLYGTYADKSLNMATGSMGSAMRCVSEQQAQAARVASRTPVETNAPAAAGDPSGNEAASAAQPASAAPAAAAAEGGGSNGTLWTIVGAAAGTTALVAALGSGVESASSQCTYPTDVSFDACFDPRQGGNSPACQSALQKVDKYCECRHMRRGSGTAQFNQCVP
jgi:hypothetical protein